VYAEMEMWTEVRRRVLNREISKRAACEQYELHWKTLEKILAHVEPPGYRRTKERTRPKLGPFLPWIHEVLEADRSAPPKQRHTAQRIFDRRAALEASVRAVDRRRRLRSAACAGGDRMSETKSTVLVKHHLKALKLPTMGRECEKIALRAAHRCHILEAKGESYHLRDARRRQRNAAEP